MASEALTKDQRKAFIAAWLGWAFDGLDGFLYSLVAVPFVAELLQTKASDPEVAKKAALIQAVFLIGWAFGGAFFGRIGDKLGRTKTLTLTVLVYALFTGMSALATTWWMLMGFRFLAALGIGGEWAAGSSLVSETLHSKHRAWASALLQSGYMCGMILAALTIGWMGAFESYRYVFLVGVLPALMTVWIRKAVPEPEEWKGERVHRDPPPISSLFKKGIVGTTVLTAVFVSICLTTVWAFVYFSNPILRGLPEVKSMQKADADALIRNVTIIFTLWNIAANFLSTYTAKYIGYKRAFSIFMALTFACCYFGYRDGGPKTVEDAQFWFNVTSFIVAGVFGIFPLYIPRLFPTLIRTTGAGFCYNFGRVIAAFGSIFGGAVAAAGNSSAAIYYIGFLAIPGIFIGYLMPEIPYSEEIAEGTMLAES